MIQLVFLIKITIVGKFREKLLLLKFVTSNFIQVFVSC